MADPRSRRRVIVTGASSGLGSAIARAFVADGADVLLLGRNAQGLRAAVAGGVEACDATTATTAAETVRTLRAEVLAGGQVGPRGRSIAGRAYWHICDVGNPSEIDAAVQLAGRLFGDRLDVLVNNAGTSGALRMPADRCTLAQWNDVMAVNITAPFWFTRQCVPMLQKAQGCVINISSTVALRAVPQLIPYNVSKAGLDHFTRAAALDLGPLGIRVNSINPGAIDTNILRRLGMKPDRADAFYAGAAMLAPLGRPGTPEDVAAVAIFLASEGASWLTGVILPVDGGRQAGNPLSRSQL